MARSTPSKDSIPQPPRLRRAYYDCRFGQLHVHNAIPSGGGFDELTSVICLPGAGETGRVFTPALHALGFERSVYALDLPGTGETDPAPGVDAIEAAISTVGDFVDSMRIRSFDLLARGGSEAAALRLLEQRGAAVRRVILVAPLATTRGGPRVTVLSAADATAASLPERLVELLAAAT
jgi:pimeloyl-ACP methyl ester carboxylesterase